MPTRRAKRKTGGALTFFRFLLCGIYAGIIYILVSLWQRRVLGLLLLEECIDICWIVYRTLGYIRSVNRLTYTTTSWTLFNRVTTDTIWTIVMDRPFVLMHSDHLLPARNVRLIISHNEEGSKLRHKIAEKKHLPAQKSNIFSKKWPILKNLTKRGMRRVEKLLTIHLQEVMRCALNGSNVIRARYAFIICRSLAVDTSAGEDRSMY